MQKYLVVYGASPETIEKWSSMTPEEQKNDMDAWMAWMQKYEASFVDPGNPVGKNKRVNQDGTADQTNEICGFSIVQAESHEAAAAIFTDSPHLESPGAYIEVMPIGEM